MSIITKDPMMNYKELLDEYVQGVELLFSKVSTLPDDQLLFRPAIEDAWTIKEHVIHLVDSEMNGFIRCKSIIAQPFSNCFVMDEDKWTINIRRKNEDLKKYLSVFRLIREMTHDLLKDEEDVNWNKDFFVREYKGEVKQITIEKCIELYRNHLHFHIGYIDRNLKEYKDNK